MREPWILVYGRGEGRVGLGMVMETEAETFGHHDSVGDFTFQMATEYLESMLWYIIYVLRMRLFTGWRVIIRFLSSPRMWRVLTFQRMDHELKKKSLIKGHRLLKFILIPMNHNLSYNLFLPQLLVPKSVAIAGKMIGFCVSDKQLLTVCHVK